MNTHIKNKIKKLLAASLAVTSIILSMPTLTLAVNEQFDDPNDNMVSQNEAYEDLLNEPNTNAPSITGTSYILVDEQSGAILCGRNIDEQLEPASTTKVMTVLIALETLSLDEIITITPNMYTEIPDGYTLLGITEGEQFTVRDLVYAALLISANDATLALAVHMGNGSQQTFVNTMNQRAQELGCTNTHFSNSYGLADPSHLTTARDLAIIINEATKNSTFCEIATTVAYSVPATNIYTSNRDIQNANQFICSQEFSYDYYIGGKTGYTDSAGYTLVSAASHNDRKLVGVILGSTSSDQRYRDMISLFDYGYSYFSTLQIDFSEITHAVDLTIEQYNSSLINSDREVTENEFMSTLSTYLTTTTSRVSGGGYYMVSIPREPLDVSIEDQTIVCPICRVFNDGKTYIVGALSLRITNKSKIIDINPIKKTPLHIFRGILITILALAVLVFILGVSLKIYAVNYNRKKEKAHQNKHRNNRY